MAEQRRLITSPTWYAVTSSPMCTCLLMEFMTKVNDVMAWVTSDGCEWYIERNWISGKGWCNWQGETLDDTGWDAGTLYDGGRISWGDNGSVWKCCDIARCGVVMMIRILLVVCKIRRRDWDSTLKHGRWFEGDRRTVYKERLFVVGGFSFHLSLLLLLYSKAIDNAGTALILVLPWFLYPNFEHLFVPQLY